MRGTLFTVAGHPDDCVTVHSATAARAPAASGLAPASTPTPFARRPPGRSAAGAEIALTGERASLACVQYHHLMEGRGMVRAVTRDEYAHDPKIGPRRGRNAAEDADAVPRLQVRRLQMGHGDRRQRLHRLQRLRRRLPGGEQHPGDRQGPGASRPRDALAPHRHVLPRAGGESGNLLPARAVHAVRERAVRGRSARSARRRTATKG